ncbi:MAG TPA: hypothetical protein VGM89_01730, partial [Puia sp.]
MNPSLVLAERRLRTVLKLLLIACFLILLFHVFPKWTPGFLEGFAFHGYTIISNNSFPQGGLIALLLGLVIADIRRFSILIRLLIGFLIIGVIWSLIGWIKDTEPDAGEMPFWVRTVVYAVLLIGMWILFSVAGKARYDLKYLTV